MDTIFMNSENSKTCDPQKHLLNVSDKIELKRSDKYIALSNLSIHFTERNVKSHHLRHGMKSLNYLMDHTLYQIFKIILSILSKNIKINRYPPIRKYVNKIKSRILFKLKIGYYLSPTFKA